jgi:hypothetical protein
LSALEVLSVVGNNLYGTIPSSIGKLTRLNFLQLGINYLTGTLPKSLSNLPKLEHMYMSNNELTGTVPTILSLASISLNNNFLTGTISDSGSFSDLQRVYVYNNLISGSIPKSYLTPRLLDLALGGGSLSNQLFGSLDLVVSGHVAE